MPAVLPNSSAVRTLMKISDVINVVEEAFRMCGEGRGKMFARTCLAVDNGDFRVMSAALPGCKGVKRGKRTPRRSISWSTFDLERGGNQ